jgi:hypothetical protein
MIKTDITRHEENRLGKPWMKTKFDHARPLGISVFPTETGMTMIFNSELCDLRKEKQLSHY